MTSGGRPGLRAPKVPLGPGRDAYSKRTRLVLAIVLVVAIAAVVVVALVASLLSKTPPARIVTIPQADERASPALIQAAEAVRFHPNVEPGVGIVEGEKSPVMPPSASGLLAPGKTAPGFKLETPAGEPVSLRSLRGRAVLLEFFATWCPHCGAEAPHLKAMAGSLPSRRYAFVSVNADGEDAASILAYHIYFGLPFPALLDPSSHPGSFRSPGLPGRVSKAYRVSSYPTFYVLDPAGKVVWAGSGEQPDELLRNELRRAAGT
jgi:peroxiredoxin